MCLQMSSNHCYSTPHLPTNTPSSSLLSSQSLWAFWASHFLHVFQKQKLHTQTRPSLLLLSLSIITSPFCSLSLSLQSQSLSTYWVCGCFFFALFPSFVCGFNGFSPTLSLVFLSLYLIWVSVFWA